MRFLLAQRASIVNTCKTVRLAGHDIRQRDECPTSVIAAVYTLTARGFEFDDGHLYLQPFVLGQIVADETDVKFLVAATRRELPFVFGGVEEEGF